MSTNLIALTTVTLITLACGAEPNSAPSAVAGSSAMATAGSGGQSTVGQAGANAGANASGSGASASGASAGGAGAAAFAGAAASGASAGAAGGGTTGTGGAGGASSGGAGGASSGGADGMSDVAQALEGMRVDDGCAGTADTSVGAVCGHAMLTASNGFKGTKEATISGSAGAIYDVTLRIRGVVEPTAISGGMRPDTSTFQYRSMDWRKLPFTIGGTVSQATTDPDYTQWHIGVASPKGDFYLNDYQKTGHYIFKLDYQITIQVAANSTVTLDGTDRNERQIVNYEKYALEGIPGSVNYGQFIQINVVAVKSR